MVVILDTGFILALRNEDDSYHEQTVQAMEEILKGKLGQIIVTDYVFDEVATLAMIRTKNKNIVKDIGEYILNSKRLKLFFITDRIFLQTWKLFLQYYEQGLSFTDCSCIALMKAIEPKSYIATYDQTLAKMVTIVPLMVKN